MSARKLVGLVHNPHVPEAADVVASLVKSLGIKDSSWIAPATDLEVAAETLASTSVIITAGGDGTILRVVRVAAPHGVPILGINMGRVGFMAEVTVDEALDRTESYIRGSPRIEERMMLRATVFGPNGDGPILVVDALNDVVTRTTSIGLLDVEAKVDGFNLTTYRADGLIAATPTGSTGYALSAGGPIMYPEAREILLQPLAAHMSFQTGIVISAESVIELSLKGDREAILSADGFVDASLCENSRVTIESSPYVARFLRKGPQSEFYSTLMPGLGVSGHRVAPATGL